MFQIYWVDCYILNNPTCIHISFFSSEQPTGARPQHLCGISQCDQRQRSNQRPGWRRGSHALPSNTQHSRINGPLKTRLYKSNLIQSYHCCLCSDWTHLINKTISFPSLLKLHRDVQCVYWNFNKNSRSWFKSSLHLLDGLCVTECLCHHIDGHGGWDDDGCRKENSSSQYTTCLCDHLTHFGVLLVCVYYISFLDKRWLHSDFSMLMSFGNGSSINRCRLREGVSG